MHLLLSNDDGVHGPGLICLFEYMRNTHDLSVVAPDRDRSGASNSLTLNRPLHPIQMENSFISVDGTPTDCVHLAINALCDKQPYRVISGINSGANLGDDVLYSGTVAAAMEGRFLEGTPIAISLAGKQHFNTAARVLVKILGEVDRWDLPQGTVLNINVPDLPFDQLKGWQFCRLGHRAKSDNPVQVTNPRGKQCYWISVAGQGADAGPGTDFYAIEQSYVAITPIHVDMTHSASLGRLQNQFPDLGSFGEINSASNSGDGDKQPL